MLFGIVAHLDKTRVEKEKKLSFLNKTNGKIVQMCHFIYRRLDEVPHCYTWHKNTLYNQHAALSVGLLTNDLSNRD
jgi:hypothetical protein